MGQMLKSGVYRLVAPGAMPYRYMQSGLALASRRVEFCCCCCCCCCCCFCCCFCFVLFSFIYILTTSNNASPLQFKFDGIFVLFTHGNDMTANICTWHDSGAVVSCTNICSDQSIKIWKRTKYFLLNLNYYWRRVSEMGPSYVEVIVKATVVF